MVKVNAITGYLKFIIENEALSVHDSNISPEKAVSFKELLPLDLLIDTFHRRGYLENT